MDFFQRQDAARASTTKLVLLMIAGVTCVVTLIVSLAIMTAPKVFLAGPTVYDLNRLQLRDVQWDSVVVLALSILAFMGCAVIYKTIALGASKGHGIAASLGGRLVDHSTTDAQERVLLNVVEEMAIASGVPVPAVYIMDEEDSINAFAAGFRHDEAVIGVTRGSVTTLSRDELQGIIGHEFSHILNGDMRLNLKLIGVLFGLLVLSEVGRIMMRSGSGSRRSSNSKGGGQLMLLAIGVFVVGSIGYFFGALIKAAISRQREFLADASSVQFTRNPLGLAGAFKKIQGLDVSALKSGHAGEVSHMMFASSLRHWFGGWMATHPPIEQRLEALTGQKYAATVAADAPSVRASPAGVSGFAAGSAVGNVGRVTPEHLKRAQTWMKGLNANVTKAAHDPLDATALVLALLISPDGAIAKQQAMMIKERNAVIASAVGRVFKDVSVLKVTERLSIIDLAMPALLTLSMEQRQALLDSADQLIKADNKIDLFEYTCLKILKNRLARGRDKHLAKQQDKGRATTAATVVLSAISSASHTDPSACADAYKAGASRLPGNALTSITPVAWTYEQLDDALTCLDQLLPMRKKALLDACAFAVAHDGVVSENEAQIFRAVSEAVGCPTAV